MLSLYPGLRDGYLFEEARTNGIRLRVRERMTMQKLLNLRLGGSSESCLSLVLTFRTRAFDIQRVNIRVSVPGIHCLVILGYSTVKELA